MSDYIKREDALKIINDMTENEDDYRRCTNMINELPPADVVEADKAQKEIDYWHDKAQSYEQTILKLSLNKADVVEVVRCKDCKHHAEFSSKCNKLNLTPMWPNDYCSYGERAEE